MSEEIRNTADTEDDNKTTEQELPKIPPQADDDKIPLDFSYYKATDNTKTKRTLTLLAGCAVFAIIFAGAIKTVNQKTNKPFRETEIVYIDAYEGSPYAYDTEKLTENNMTENGLYYTEYAEHIRITKYRDILYPYDLVIPAYIDNKPVTEIDYYVFSYSVLKSLKISNPECIFFEDGNMPPVDVNVPIIASEDSKAHEMAVKFGNPFTAESTTKGKDEQ